MAKGNSKEKSNNEKAEMAWKKKPAINKSGVKSASTTCSKCNKPFSYDPDKGDAPKLCKECYDKQHVVVYNGVCKDCGKEFYVTAGEAEWLKSHDLSMPKRCYECRTARRVAKANEKQDVKAQ